MDEEERAELYIYRAKELIDLALMEWGAHKAAKWEIYQTGEPFSCKAILPLIKRALDGET